MLEKYLLPKFAAWKARDIKRSDLPRLHLSMQGHPYQANRLLAVVASMYSFGEKYGLTPEGFNPTLGIDRFPEAPRQRLLSRDEMSCVGEALKQAETTGLPWEIDEEKPTAKHAPKENKRRTVLDPFAVAAIRLLILTGGRLREILDALTSWHHDPKHHAHAVRGQSDLDGAAQNYSRMQVPLWPVACHVSLKSRVDG